MQELSIVIRDCVKKDFSWLDFIYFQLSEAKIIISSVFKFAMHHTTIMSFAKNCMQMPILLNVKAQ